MQTRCAIAPVAVPRKDRPPRIVVILPRGEAIRNVVYSGLVDFLSENCEVLALSVMPNEDVIQEIARRPLKLRPLEDYSEARVVNILREILNVAHGRHLWSEAARQRWMLRDWEAKTPALKAKRKIKAFTARVFAHKPGLALLSSLERLASRWLRTTDHYLNLFNEWRPDLVFNGSHVHGELAVQPVQAAQWMGIPTAAFIFSWDNLTSQGRILPSYDYYVVWNSNACRQLCDIYPQIRPDRISITGTPQFDFHFQRRSYWSREEFCARVGADPFRPIILYSTGMANHMPGEDRIVEVLADLLENMSDPKPQLLVRVYPKDRTGRFEDLRKRRPEILFPAVPWETAHLTPRVEDLALLTNTLRHCAAGVNVASTISLELCMFDKPVINVAFDPPGIEIHPIHYANYYNFDHYAPVVASGAVETAGSLEELDRKLRSALRQPTRLSEQRRTFLNQMFGSTLDGGSAARVARVLSDLAQGNKSAGRKA